MGCGATTAGQTSACVTRVTRGSAGSATGIVRLAKRSAMLPAKDMVIDGYHCPCCGKRIAWPSFCSWCAERCGKGKHVPRK